MKFNKKLRKIEDPNNQKLQTLIKTLTEVVNNFSSLRKFINSFHSFIN